MPVAPVAKEQCFFSSSVKNQAIERVCAARIRRVRSTSHCRCPCQSANLIARFATASKKSAEPAFAAHSSEPSAYIAAPTANGSTDLCPRTCRFGGPRLKAKAAGPSGKNRLGQPTSPRLPFTSRIKNEMKSPRAHDNPARLATRYCRS